MKLSGKFLAALLSLTTLAAGPVPARANETSGQALDRGRLSLAWDAHDSGLWAEALGYLGEIPADSPLFTDALWLRVECLYDLGRHSEAAELLSSPAAAALPEREDLLFDVVWDHVWQATTAERFDTALAVVERARRWLPDDLHLAALEEATRFRREVQSASGPDAARSPGGGPVRLQRRGAAPPPGAGWVRVYPWEIHGVDLPRLDLGDWLPSLAARLDAEDRVLWLQVSASELLTGVAARALTEGMVLQREEDVVLLQAGGQTVTVSLDTWLMRAAVEGLGARGAGTQAVAEATDRLAERAELVAWVESHRGELAVRREGAVLRLHHPGSGRSFDLDPRGWADLFALGGDEWDEFWYDLRTELAREPRPYRCFCGRPVQLREVVVSGSGNALAWQLPGGLAAELVALCPKHLQHLTPDLVAQWGVGAESLRERARLDALTRPWEIGFSRGQEAGVSYLVLEGEGVAALVWTPELLLGALEAVDGSEVRGQTVGVLVPSGSALVVARSRWSEAVADRVTARVLMAAGRRGEPAERIGFRTTLRLPSVGSGEFRPRAVE